MRQIARNYLSQVTLTLAKSGKTFGIEDDALELVVKDGYNVAFGARFLKRFIDEHIKLPISARWNDGLHFAVKLVDGHIVVEPSVAKAISPSDALAYGDVA